MITIKKCKSRKHKRGGCGNPKCPEGLSIAAAIERAVQNQDINSFFLAKEIENKKPIFSNVHDGIIELSFDSASYTKRFHIPVDRPEAKNAIKSIDKSFLQSYDSVKSMEAGLNDLYNPYALVKIENYEDKDQPALKRLYVASMKVDADVRGLGSGKHMRQTILKFADEHGYVVTGTPTESGDGMIPLSKDNEEEWTAHALKHQQRLVSSYLNSGYEYNYAYMPSDKVNYLTKEPHPENRDYVAQFNERGKRFLIESGFYIRWPNNKIPKEYLAGYKFPKPLKAH